MSFPLHYGGEGFSIMQCGRGRSRPSRRTGFTLIEVLVVVAIIALLVAILLPSMARARRQARRSMCASNLHQIGAALLMYHSTHHAFPHQARVGVPGCDPDEPGGNGIGAWPTSVHNTISRYIGKTSNVRPNEVFYCPSVRESDRGSVDIDREQPACTVGNPEPYLHITYFYYGRLNAVNNDPAKPRPSFGEASASDVPLRRKLYVVKEPDARRVVMTDAVSLWTGGTQWRINHGPDYTRYQPGTPPQLEGQNVAYGDGHVEWNPRTRPQFKEIIREGATKSDLDRSALFHQYPDLHWW